MEMLKRKLNLLPTKPGVYLMKDSTGNVIYVGKAKVLKNRVRSYFTGSHDQKTQKLVSNIRDFEYILTSSEVEALLLECNLIKKYNPRYNILLKDDKTYPYLLITSEKHPRIVVTRKINKKTGKYFGPYPNASAAKEAARLLNRLLPLRKCNKIPSKSCLYYHLGQCFAPCINQIHPDEYSDTIEKASIFLRGNQKSVITWLEERMNKASECLQFEAAKEYRDLINDLKKISEKQNITLNDFRNRDIVSYFFDQDLISIQVFSFRQGMLVTREGFIFPYYAEVEEAFISFLVQYYSTDSIIPDEICIPEIASTSVHDILPLTTPKRIKIRELIDLATSNAEISLKEKVELEGVKTEESMRALEGLKELLNIPSAYIIEAFDISGLSGTNVVGGMVQFIQGKPSRSNYRKYNIPILEKNNDDTAYLKHVVFRRYNRLKLEQSTLPNLILVDGGKGQVKAVRASLRELQLNIPVAGMVKNEKHVTRSLLSANGKEFLLDMKPETFRFIQRVQEEVHRFAITFHRQQRQKNMISSELDGIEGIGPKRKRLLLRHFQSIEGIKNACIEDLTKVGLPSGVAKEVYDFFRQSN